MKSWGKIGMLFFSALFFPGLPGSAAAKSITDCHLQNCGKGGPYPTLQAACEATVQRWPNLASEPEPPACHLATEKRKNFLRDCADDPKCPHVPIADSYLLPLKGPTMDQAATFSLGDHPRVYLIALHTAAGWQVMGEFIREYHPSSMGQSDALGIEYLKPRALLPGRQLGIELSYTLYGIDSDMGINRIAQYESNFRVLCGLDPQTQIPFCTRPLPIKLRSQYQVLMDSEEKELCHKADPPCPRTYDHLAALEIRVNPAQGMISTVLVRGRLHWIEENLRATIQNILGSKKILSLPQM